MDDKQIGELIHQEISAHEHVRAHRHLACHLATWCIALIIAVAVLHIALIEAVMGQGPILLMEIADGKFRL